MMPSKSGLPSAGDGERLPQRPTPLLHLENDEFLTCSIRIGSFFGIASDLPYQGESNDTKLDMNLLGFVHEAAK